MSGELLTISSPMAGEAARERVSQFATGFETRIDCRLLYPYDWTAWRLTTGRWCWHRTVTAHCLVDARTAQAATCDRFASEMSETADAVTMATTISEPALLAAARVYVGHAHTHLQRALTLPDVELVERRRLHRSFWVVACARPRGEAFRVLVDGVTGALQVMLGGAL